MDVPGQGTEEGTAGAREEDLAYLEARLEAASEPIRIVLMHMPPYVDERYAPHTDWGFKQRESEFLQLLRRYDVGLVCCAHGLGFDTCIRDGVRFVMSGGGGSGLCSHYRGVCTAGPGRPEDRGAVFHVVELTVGGSGSVSGRVLQAFDVADNARRSF